MISSRFRIATCAVLITQALRASSGFAQSPSEMPRNSISIVAGASQFDLAGTGTAPAFGIRLDRAVAPWLVTQASLSTLSPKEQLGTRNRYFIPEIQVQGQLRHEKVRPYLGIGTGFFLGNNGSRKRATYSAALGTRVRVPERPIDLLLELRLRGIGETFSGSAAEWTAGLAYRF